MCHTHTYTYVFVLEWKRRDTNESTTTGADASKLLCHTHTYTYVFVLEWKRRDTNESTTTGADASVEALKLYDMKLTLVYSSLLALLGRLALDPINFALCKSGK